jgi:transcriptional regulator, propionate catabolism operon regulatory protein
MCSAAERELVMAITIAIISYYKLTEVVARAKEFLPPDVTVRIVNCNLLTQPERIKESLALQEEVDVFVSASGNYSVLSAYITEPMVEIKPSVTDILLAMKKSANPEEPIALLKYHTGIDYLNDTKELFLHPVVQYVYKTADEAERMIQQFIHMGITTFIGSSFVYESVTKAGYPCFFLYSEDSVIRALETAVAVARTKRQEMVKTIEIKTMLRSTQEGIIAINGEGIVTIFNPSAEKITKIQHEKVVGRRADEVLPALSLHTVQHSGKPQLNQVQKIGEVQILTNRVPIKTKQGISGAIVTFNDIGMVQKAEKKIRETLHKKGFVAKTTFEDILGDSQRIEEVKDMALQYARWKASVLIIGESGTGKELFAQAIHNASLRSNGPFVAINCAALPESLLESELFGYENGAFTGAKKGGRQGLFELAHEGTIFLDEIAEMPMAIQSRVLRVLEEHEVLRIGGERIIPINIRVLAATNKNLWELVQCGIFRKDLYYRLCVLELRIPSLQERREDIPPLITKFLSDFRPDLPEDVIRQVALNPLLKRYEWDGNVRQLRNMIERIAVLYKTSQGLSALIETLLQQQVLLKGADTESNEIYKVLREAHGNKSLAAKKLGISRATLWRKLQKAEMGEMGTSTESVSVKHR